MSQRVTAIKFTCPNDSRGGREHQVSTNKLYYTIHSGNGLVSLIKVRFICPYCKREHEKLLKGAI